MNLTTKENDLLKDMKGQEQLCIDKYNKYSESAKDKQLQSLFKEIASTEQEHLNTLTQIESGTVPQMQAGNQSSNQGLTVFASTYNTTPSPEKAADEYLCKDTLTMEKHVSSVYDTSIFEFCNKELRDVLNHIQKEEQQHGKKLYDYMSTNAMYG